MANEESISRKAVRFVVKYEKKQGREALDMQTDPKFKGFDILSFSEDKKDIRAIEVKGTQTKGIPDMFETEVTRNKKLIATHLYVVRFDKNKNVERFFIIPSFAVKSEDLTETRSYRISSNFKTQRMKEYEVSV